jgi:EAL domain-containing protein (putative c-di-GMP-specific phosphodiesterase class I)
MYGAKRQDSSLEVFDDGIRDRVAARSDMEADLRRAVSEGEFRLLYQPQVSLRSGEIVGLEALLRWDHPTRGLIEPAEFLWLAEETGAIKGIGDWVLAESSRQAALWREAGPDGTPLRVCVNLSARQHADPSLVETVARVTEEAGIDPSSLCLEITEGIVMQDEEAALRTLRALEELGVVISMDDFGSSQSSLGALKRFPLDILKVDRSFVAGLGEEPEDTAIVNAVINMAHALGLVTVADGVETRMQLEQLKEVGCDVGQGYYFARPRPAEAIAELLGAGERAA